MVDVDLIDGCYQVFPDHFPAIRIAHDHQCSDPLALYIQSRGKMPNRICEAIK
jgi:hypothetical protein